MCNLDTLCHHKQVKYFNKSILLILFPFGQAYKDSQVQENDKLLFHSVLLIKYIHKFFDIPLFKIECNYSPLICELYLVTYFQGTKCRSSDCA